MRALFSAACCVLLFSLAASAQNSPDCRTAIPVCADAPIMGTTDGSGDIDDFDPEVITQTGCLEKGSVSSANIENNTGWYVFRAGTDGQIGFDIEALPVNPGSPITAEWDFALYGPFDETSGENYCTIVGNGSAQPIRCNYEYNDTGFTGIGVNPVDGRVGAPFVKQSQNTYDEWLNVTAGEIYYLYINNYNTNFDEDPESFILTFTGSSVDADQDSALDCTLRDEFLGLDIVACEGDPDIVLSALNSPVGPSISNIVWELDADDDGTYETVLASGADQTELTVSSPNSGRYRVTIQSTFGTTITDDILITFYGTPELDEVVVIDDLVHSDQTDPYNVEIVPLGDGNYEYSLNGGEYQDDPIFYDVPPGMNEVVINDKNGCGTSDAYQFLVVGYPKFFTPNGDSVHDNWNVYGIEQLNNAVVYIFDRYGKLLKQMDLNTGWDGTFNGRDLPSSDYWFRLDYDRDDEGVLVARSVRRHFSLVR
ncbi:gliding motility-associated C-terminal domain-containing protein [Flagellimonas taeanensis]|uniref:T9SS type B sorting domain-containing protein n=1 Tax=Flavobacteriaceae TaxID=49546 RepID=UPI000E682368|nr:MULTISPECIES: T9SS type B sorting domain-containing protein [Allomuricauda]MDC6386453.1 T9SS type B sorting domain-containing protein [Muricauda sp. SK9]RIV52038.1 gliding motility-associated C-terminal domain-containing protein [Allomuricauda taeanensis]